ncbi:Flp family type IVb pilin [Burkholderia pyrrocinia]|uniref:Flp family type IVb pilin n=1 Tax=Burkholderia pyrrocinia TaxID=60550 RepID=UPI001BCD0997|nr:Flp family type IVb pilin [Burkholderia pyrrocinia]QVN22883.1 Flp family type IVb pilin [Burkholderia pyrrocinia]
MSKFIQQVSRFVRDEDGVTAIEYGLIAALIAVGIIAALSTVGKDLKTVFSTIADDLDSAVAAI